MLEAAFILPLPLMLTFSVIDFACLFYVHLAIENGISQATRYAITGNLMAEPDDAGEQ
jgi:Flp pilus assembly protein TadG